MSRIGQTVQNLSPRAYENLKTSGLTDEYIELMRIAPNKNEKPGVHDYAIPYFDFKGSVVKGFYRIRRLRDNDLPGAAKYIQPAGSPNRLWIPPNWLRIQQGRDYVIITEGEKKAASVAQHNLPIVALGGVDNWNTKKLQIDLSKLERVADDQRKVTLTLDEHELDIIEEQVAPEFIDLVKHLTTNNKTAFIIFDTDTENGLKEEVQRAAFNLAIWLDSQGVENVKLAVLPPGADNAKVGLDDYLIENGPKELEEFLRDEEHSFPVHPHPKKWIRNLLNGPRLTRNHASNIARTVVAGLDSRGKRFVDEAGRFYYFDSRSKILHTFFLGSNDLRNFRLDTFGSFLHAEFGVGTSDGALLSRIADSFVTVPGIETTTPRRVVHTTENALYYQLSDSRMARVNEKRIEVVDNGTDGVLFLSGQVEAIKSKLTLPKREEPGWMEVLQRTSIQPMEGMSMRQTRILLTCLFYLNPWFRRWRGLMLPIELAIAEPNSGKSFLYNLRSAILVGNPTLKHAPSSIRDWYADLASTPAFWIGDNLGRLPNALRNTMSDELARLVTDPNPSVSLRKLYTTAENTRLPVDCTFAMTAINNPFTKEDIMQRSIVISLQAVPAGTRDGKWYNREIEDGGRESWLAEHLITAQKFLKLAKSRWKENYLSNHRLVNFEQSLLIMGEVLGYKDEMDEVVTLLSDTIQENIAQFNPVIEALRAYVRYRYETGAFEEPFFASDVVEWAIGNFEFGHVRVLQEARQLGRYVGSHAYDIKQSTGIYKEEGRTGGKSRYLIDMIRAKKFLDNG